MEVPQIRPGKVSLVEAMPRVVAYFHNSAQGNAAVQLLITLGVPSDRLGVTTPERIESGQGMILSIACPEPGLVPKVEAICKGQGANFEVLRR